MSFFVASAPIRRAATSNAISASSQVTWFRRKLFKPSASTKSAPASPSMPQAQQHGATSRHVDILTNCDIEQLYKYTSGRWLWDEKNQFARRYVKFNLPGLLEVSAQAIGARSCIRVDKLPEGNFSKVFLLTMDDGRELIAKLPNPNAGQAHYMTASEAATMDYVRNVLGIPAPQIYGWSSSTDNPVGAEYILMERSRGVELSKIWDNISWEERLEVVRTLVGYEKAFISAALPAYGSLYYARDLHSHHSAQLLDYAEPTGKGKGFAVGPTTNRAFFDQGRGSVDVNRGPWPSLKEFIKSRADRELACINVFSSYPSQQGLFGGPNQYRPTKELKVKVLQDYLKVAAHILPSDASLSKPTLWHSDLHADNIFVDPSQPTKIINIIDWQAVNIAPLFLQARHPSLIEFEGPIPEGFDQIDLPNDFESLSSEEQQRAKNIRAAQSLHKLYEILMLRQCPEIAHALRYRETLTGQITGIASSIFSDGEPILQGMLIRLQDEWSIRDGPSVSCPLSFTLEDRAKQQRLEASWGQGVELMHDVLTEIGAYQGWDGWVNHSNYAAYKERLAQCRENFLNRYAKTEEDRTLWNQVWPFQDRCHAPASSEA